MRQKHLMEHFLEFSAAVGKKKTKLRTLLIIKEITIIINIKE